MKKFAIILIVLMLVDVVFLSGCTEETSQKGISPIINSFTATPVEVIYDNSSLLNWSIEGATSISLDNGIGSIALNGPFTIVPIETRKYTITASNNYGNANASVIIYVYNTYEDYINEMPPAGTGTPSIAWSIDNAERTLTITSGSAYHHYASSEFYGNLIFRSPSGSNYYVDYGLRITSVQSSLSIKTIDAGDIIEGFTSGTWQVIWMPTDKLLGTITFS